MRAPRRGSDRYTRLMAWMGEHPWPITIVMWVVGTAASVAVVRMLR